MKKIILLFIFAVSVFTAKSYAQDQIDSTGLLGDNFSLQGALEMFKKAESPEDFEKRINQEDNYVNNLDLNEDGEIDYIRIEDQYEGEVHALVLQAVIGEKDVQDIAVIEIEKTADESAILQIVGDETLYGPETYVEPFESEVQESGKNGPNADLIVSRVVVNVWFWPSVRFMYAPHYVVYHSPWYWRAYPRWYKPWRPFSWRVYHGHHHHRYHHHYRVVNTHRVVRAHKVYTPRRKSSTVVVKKSSTRVAVRKNGVVTKKKTTVVRKNEVGKSKASKRTVEKSQVKRTKKADTGVVKKKTEKTTAIKKNGRTKAVKKESTKTSVRKKGNKKSGKKSSKARTKKSRK